VEETKEFLKKYWPYVIGGIVGLYIVMKYMGGSSSSSSTDPYSAYLQSQTALQGQNLQAQMQQAQIDANTNAQNAANTLAQNTLDVQNNANYATAFNNFQSTQAQMVTALGTGVSQVVTALNQPSITALQSAAYENSAALQAAGNVAASSFLAQGQIASGATSMFGSAISAIGKLGQFSAQQPAGPITGAINTGIKAYSAYATNGASTIGSGSTGNYSPGSQVYQLPNLGTNLGTYSGYQGS